MLDDSGYEQILEKSLARIPMLCPDWTNTRQSDIGLTLLQLMAVFTDMQNYHADSVTDRHKEAYLKLIGEKRRGIKCAQVAVETERTFVKGERVKIGRHFFEYSREINSEKIFIQKETLVKKKDMKVNKGDYVDVPCADFLHTAFFIKDEKENIWIPLKKDFDKPSLHGTLRTVFYDSNVQFVFGETSGITMQEIILPYKNILPCSLKLWINYGDYYKECGFNYENGKIILGNGRDFPVPKAGGLIEAFSLVLNDGEIRISPKQKLYVNGIETQRKSIAAISSGSNGETADCALSRAKTSYSLLTLNTEKDFERRIAEVFGLDSNAVLDSRTNTMTITVYPLIGVDISNLAHEIERRLLPFKPLTMTLLIVL